MVPVGEQNYLVLKTIRPVALCWIIRQHLFQPHISYGVVVPM